MITHVSPSRSVARLRLRDSKALERLQVLRSKPSAHFSTHLLTVVMGENATPQVACDLAAH